MVGAFGRSLVSFVLPPQAVSRHRRPMNRARDTEITKGLYIHNWTSGPFFDWDLIDAAEMSGVSSRSRDVARRTAQVISRLLLNKSLVFGAFPVARSSNSGYKKGRTRLLPV